MAHVNNRKQPLKRRRRKSALKRLTTFLVVVLLLFGAFYVAKSAGIDLPQKIAAFFDGSRVKRPSIKLDRSVETSYAEMLKDAERFKVTQSLLLINDTYGLPDNFHADVGFYKDTKVLMNRAMLEDYARLSAAVTEATDSRMYVMSVLRSREEQKALYDKDSSLAQRPGHSEHETGLAADVYVSQYAGANFIESDAGNFVNASSWKYGFIIRYPNGKEKVTGIPYEPWHIRYVGPVHAAAMHDAGQALEEYIESLSVGIWFKLKDHLVSRQRIDGPITLPEHHVGPIEVSPDNTGHVILTVRRR